MSVLALKDILKKARFSEKEIEVYSSLLKLGSSIASDLAKQAKINRSTTYVILGTLIERDLIKVNDRKGAKMYVANPPENLVKYFEEQEKEYGEFAKAIKKMLPELKKQYASTKIEPILSQEEIERYISDLLKQVSTLKQRLKK